MRCCVVAIHTCVCGQWWGRGDVSALLRHMSCMQALFGTGFEVCDRVVAQVMLQGGQSGHMGVPCTRAEVSKAIMLLRSQVVC